MPYYIFFLTSSVTFFACLDWGFFRSNLITKESPHNFSYSRCIATYMMSIPLLAIGQAAMFFLFIYRMQISFKATTYEYPRKIYFILYIILLICLLFQICFASMAILIGDAQYALYYFDDDRSMIWCDVLGEGSYSDQDKSDIRRTIAFLNGIYLLLYNVGYDALFAYMFTRKLYQLQSTLLEQHISEKSELTRKQSTTVGSESGNGSHKSDVVITKFKSVCGNPVQQQDKNVGTDRNVDENETAEMEIAEMSKQRTMTIEEAESSDNKNIESVNQIVTLHKLTKKLTIIIWVLIILNIIWIATILLISTWMVCCVLCDLVTILNQYSICLWDI